MSVHSYTVFDCTFPVDTEIGDINRLSLYGGWSYGVSDKEGRYEIDFDGETSWSDGILENLTALFGKRLDEVPGLELSLNYQCLEDGYFECNLRIKDGKCEYEESEIVMRKQPMGMCPIDLDRGTPVADARKVWKELGYVGIDDGECLDRTFHGTWYRMRNDYPKGTHREEVWHDIEEEFGVSVAYLMGQAKNPDGTND